MFAAIDYFTTLGATVTIGRELQGALEPVVDRVVEIGVLAMILAIVLCLYRMLRGPHLGDRILAVEMMALNVVAVIILLSIYLESAAFLDVGLVVAVIGFTSVIAFSQYIDGQRLSRLRREAEGINTSDPTHDGGRTER